jgi:hypothetical protein
VSRRLRPMPIAGAVASDNGEAASDTVHRDRGAATDGC